MLTLLLFRHAKAERGNASLPDERRPLAARGRDAADLMGRRLAGQGFIPDLVLCSPATRALETLALAAPHWAPAPRTSIVPELYKQMSGTYIDLVRTSPTVRRLMLVAHNSATEQTARAFIGTGDEHVRARFAAGFPTAAIAVIEFEVASWADAGAGQGRLAAFLAPD